MAAHFGILDEVACGRYVAFLVGQGYNTYLLMDVTTLRSVTLEVVESESHELLNSSWMGPSGSGDPHGVQGTRCGGLGLEKKSLHTSRIVFHTKIALRGATFGRSICCWRARVGPAQSRMPPRLVLARRPSIL